MSGIYWGILLLITGSVLLTMALLANNTFEKPGKVPTGFENCGGTPGRCADEYVLGPNTVGNNKWVDYFQRHNWLVGIGIVAFLVGLVLIERSRHDGVQAAGVRLKFPVSCPLAW